MDQKTQYFKDGFDTLDLRLSERFYTSVSDFSTDLSAVIANRLSSSDGLAASSDVDIDAISSQLNDFKPGTIEHMQLTQEQKDIKRLTKRLFKAVQEPLREAATKESQLRRTELDEEMRKLDAMSIFASEKTLDDDVEAALNGKKRTASDASADAGASPEDVEMEDAADERTDEAVIHLNIAGKDDTVPVMPANKRVTPGSRTSSSHGHATRHSMSNGVAPTEPLSPPISTEGATSSRSEDPTDFFANGGVPWYLEPFDPVGTTVHEERYTGRAVLRDMSEELSDMDEDTLTELAPVDDVGETPRDKGGKSDGGDDGGSRKAPKKSKRRGRRQQWSKPRVR